MHISHEIWKPLPLCRIRTVQARPVAAPSTPTAVTPCVSAYVATEFPEEEERAEMEMRCFRLRRLMQSFLLADFLIAGGLMLVSA